MAKYYRAAQQFNTYFLLPNLYYEDNNSTYLTGLLRAHKLH